MRRRTHWGPGVLLTMAALVSVGIIELRPLGPPLGITQGLDARYEDWRAHYLARGGDANVQIQLVPLPGSGVQAPAPRGDFALDLHRGALSIQARGLEGPAELWLLDNRPGPGRTLLPEDDDRTLHVGTLREGSLEARIDPKTFDDFELDLVVLVPAGEGLLARPLLIGARSGFERRFTRERSGTDLPAVSSDPAGEARPSERDPRVALGLVSSEVLEGGKLFFDETFGGNGRTCGSCHPAENDLSLDPTWVRNRFQAHPADALFVSDPGRSDQVPALEVPSLLLQHALVRENPDGLARPAEHYVMRAVPHTLSLVTSLDAEQRGRLGWSGEDGMLRMLPVGAVVQHFTRDARLRESGPESFALPSDEQLDAIEGFLLSLGRMEDPDLDRIRLHDDSAERGRALFRLGRGGAKCFSCHEDAGARSPFRRDGGFDTGIERVRLAVLDGDAVPGDGGRGGADQPEPDRDTDGDGVPDGYGDGRFETPPLVEAADTAPFFHTHAFASLEEAVAFYNTPTFQRSDAGGFVESLFGEPIDLDARAVRDVANFLRVLNAGMNLAIALQRNQAAREIDLQYPEAQQRLTGRLLSYSNQELEDVLRVLAESDLHPLARGQVRAALVTQALARRTRGTALRELLADLSGHLIQRAADRLGQGLRFHLGEGNLAI